MAEGTLLLSLPNVSAFQLGPGSSQSVLVADSDLAVKLIDIPSTVLKTIPSASAPPSYDTAVPDAPVVVDTWLVLSLSDGLIDIPLSANSPVSFEAPRSYLIPITSEEKESSSQKENEKKEGEGIVRLQLADSVELEALDTLDSILAGWTAYPGRASPDSTAPAQVSKNEPVSKNKGRLALMDEKTGMICGELTSNIVLRESGPSMASTSAPGLQHLPPHPTTALVASHEPVMVSLTSPSGGAQGGIPVAEISSGPQGDSSLLGHAEQISRGIIAGADWLANFISTSGSSYLSRATPTTTPMTFSPTTKANTQRVLGFTQTATKVSGKTTRAIGGLASRVGDRIGKSTGIQRGPNGEMPTGARGYVSKGVLAFNTVLDSIEYGGKKVLSTAGSTATAVVTHTHGHEAGQLTDQASKSIQNVALVYIDARGVTRKAILKAAGKAAVRGQMNDGREVVFGTDANVDQWSEKAEKDDHRQEKPGSKAPDRKKQ